MSDKTTFESPTSYAPKNPSTSPSGPVTTNGEPGYPGRTPSANALPEVTYDRAVPSSGGADIQSPVK